jgi:glycosyltransferase involved in cell wall biosynthesis
MRIAYIHQYFSTREMAGGTRSFEFARRLVANGHEVHVVTTDSAVDRPSRSWRTSLVDGVIVHWLPVPYSNHMTYGRRIQAFARFAARSGLRAASVHPDLVLATSTPLTVALPGIFASRLRHAPFVFEVRDLWPELPIEIGALRHPVTKRLARWLARTAYRNAAHVVALSPGMADGVAAHGYPRERITVVPNACDLDLFDVDPEDVRRFRNARPWLQDRPLVVYGGTLGIINGVDYLVRLAAEVRDRAPDVRFLLVGEGRELVSTRRLAAELGVLDRTVFFEPPVAKAAMPAVLGAATIATSMFVPLPGMRANSANKFFDALAAGRPVAVNYGGWQADLVREAGAGLVLDPHDVAGSADALAAALRDTEWLSQAGAAARQLAGQQFSRDDLFARFERALLGQVSREPTGSSAAGTR